jgi:hypothetical protein
MQIFRKNFVRFGENMQNLRDLIPRKRRKRNNIKKSAGYYLCGIP